MFFNLVVHVRSRHAQRAIHLLFYCLLHLPLFRPETGVVQRSREAAKTKIKEENHKNRKRGRTIADREGKAIRGSTRKKRKVRQYEERGRWLGEQRGKKEKEGKKRKKTGRTITYQEIKAIRGGQVRRVRLGKG